MESIEISKCAICGKAEEDMTLYGVSHKELGWVNICRDCWRDSYDNNRLVAGSGSKSSSGCGACCGCKSN
jgi:hypothetical protein